MKSVRPNELVSVESVAVNWRGTSTISKVLFRDLEFQNKVSSLVNYKAYSFLDRVGVATSEVGALTGCRGGIGQF